MVNGRTFAKQGPLLWFMVLASAGHMNHSRCTTAHVCGAISHTIHRRWRFPGLAASCMAGSATSWHETLRNTSSARKDEPECQGQVLAAKQFEPEQKQARHHELRSHRNRKPEWDETAGPWSHLTHSGGQAQAANGKGLGIPWLIDQTCGTEIRHSNHALSWLCLFSPGCKIFCVEPARHSMMKVAGKMLHHQYPATLRM